MKRWWALKRALDRQNVVTSVSNRYRLSGALLLEVVCAKVSTTWSYWYFLLKPAALFVRATENCAAAANQSLEKTFPPTFLLPLVVLLVPRLWRRKQVEGEIHNNNNRPARPEPFESATRRGFHSPLPRFFPQARENVGGEEEGTTVAVPTNCDKM